nr:hypothetical protein [Tanacetum cinerariifolium]
MTQCMDDTSQIGIGVSNMQSLVEDEICVVFVVFGYWIFGHSLFNIWDDDDAERPDKRQKSGDRHQSTTQQSSHRNYGHNNDRHGLDRRGGGDNHRSSNNNYSGNNNGNSGNGRDQRNMGHQSNRSANSGFQQSRGPSESYSYPNQELKTVSYHKLYDILKQHQHELNEIRAEKIERVANPLELVAQQQPVYHPQTHPTHYKQNSSTRSQQAATRNRGKAIVNSPQPIYDQEPSMVNDDDETSKDKEIDKLMALISLSFKKIYKPTNNLLTSSNTSRANQDNSPRINRNAGYESQKIGNVAGAREIVEQADWKDDIDDESDDQELEADYMYMAKIQEVSPDAVDSGPIFDT